MSDELRDDAALRDLFVEYRSTGDRTLRNELVEAHVRLAEFLAATVCPTW